MNPALARILGLLGLVSLGEGIFILFRVVPHETPILGALLAVVGAVLLFLAPLPRVEHLPRWPLVVGGLAAAAGVVAFNLLRGASFAPPKVAIIVAGLALAAIAPLVRQPRVATWVAWGIPVVGAPLLVWALQAFSKTTFAGATPLEIFTQRALLPPMSSALAVMGYHPSVEGQRITFDTDRGPMRLFVGVACSGVQAMGLFAGILAVYVIAEKPGWTRGLLWSAIGLFGVYVVNIVRLVTLAVVGSAWGEDALQSAHANAGWIFFVAWAGVFAVLVTRRPKRAPATPWSP